jgi:serine/threonine protein phosphatase PrpC
VTHDTVRLSALQADFAALPEGALLNQDRFEILEILEEHTKINVYLVRDAKPVRRCPNATCGLLQSGSEVSSCSACGVDLSRIAFAYQDLLVREAVDPAKFHVEGQLLSGDLDHPGLLLPIAHFVESPYADSKRAYLAVPKSTPLLAASLPAPQQLSRVLNWGLQLARAMACLHEHHISLRAVDLNHITIATGGRIARWTNLDRVEFIDPEEEELTAKLYAEDVRTLAQILLYLSTGLAGRSPSIALGLPDEAKLLFARSVNPQQQSLRSAPEFALALEEIVTGLRQPTRTNLVVGKRTDVGLQRQLNEDGLLSIFVDQVTETSTGPLGLFAVADGMGGHSAGEVAAQLTLDIVREKAVSELFGATNDQPTFDRWIPEIIAAANAEVYLRRKQAGNDMGSTIVFAVVAGDDAYIGNVGDSRAYVIDRDSIRQITTDHSLVERLIAVGTITPEEARTHPQRNVIYRTIGDRPDIEADVFSQCVEPGQYLLLCSDGLSGMITDQEILDVVRQAASPQEACDRLVQAANDAGGGDNISVILIQNADL